MKRRLVVVLVAVLVGGAAFVGTAHAGPGKRLKVVDSCTKAAGGDRNPAGAVTSTKACFFNYMGPNLAVVGRAHGEGGAPCFHQGIPCFFLPFGDNTDITVTIRQGTQTLLTCHGAGVPVTLFFVGALHSDSSCLKTAKLKTNPPPVGRQLQCVVTVHSPYTEQLRGQGTCEARK